MRVFALAALMIIIVAGSVCGADHKPLTFYMPGGDLIISPDSPIFEMFTKTDTRAGDVRTLSARDFRNIEQSVDGQKTVLIFSAPPAEWGEDIRVVITLENVGREVLAKLSLESRSYFPIRCVRFPVMYTPKVERWDNLLLSTNVGDLMHDPRVMISTRLSGWLQWRYPADLAMQYAVFFNEARSYYMAAYYDGDEFYDHTVRTADGDRLRVSFDWYPFLDNGGKWESAQCSLSVLKGDWHSSADLYREHMAPKFKAPELPKWMTESFHGYVQLGMKGGSPTPAYKFTDLPQVYKDYVEAYGFNTLHVFSWTVDGLDHHFPDCHPSPYLGKPEELTAAIDKIRAMGGHVDLYTNGRSVDIDSDFYRNGGDKALVRTEDGGMNFEGVPTYMPKACPYSSLYQDELLKWVKVIIEKYHAGGIQIDQTSCTPALFCFDETHGHRTPAANWNTGTDKLLKQIHDYYRSVDPDFFVWIEGCSERFGQFYEVHQSHGETHSWSAGESLPEQFKYTYPDFLVVGITDNLDALCQSFGQGKPIDVRINHLERPGFGELVKDIVKVRKSEPGYFLRGKFMDNVGLTVAGDDIKHWRLDRRDGEGMVINLWGRGRTYGDRCEASVRVPNGTTFSRALYPADLKVIPDGKWLELEWSGPVASIVMEGKYEEEIDD